MRIRTKRKYTKVEEPMQIAYVQWLNLMGIPHYHPANGGSRHLLEAIKFKRMGVKRGIPDIVIPVPVFNYNGFYNELKQDGATGLTKDQAWWHDFLSKNGYFCCVSYSIDDCINNTSVYFGKYLNDVRNWYSAMQDNTI